jgi:FAD/FMN-containing dehydrogenase
MVIEELAKVVGEANVSCEETDREGFSRDMSFVAGVMPRCVVKPATKEEVERIVRIAGETLTPLVPVSSGPPHFRGDTVPMAEESIVLDMSRMKKIIHVDTRNRMAMCEPGVTFGELIPAVERAGLRLNMPILPRKEKSVVGSLLEREPVTMPGYHWDISDPLDCVEVVFGTGEVFRTGSAAGPGTIEEQWAAGLAQNQPEGPSQASLHRIIQGSQGTMGVVTWASMRCELLPCIEESFIVGEARLGRILEFAHWLIRLRLVNECFILNNVNMAAIMSDGAPLEYQGLSATLPRWILFLTIAGYEGYMPEEKVDYQIKDMMDLGRRIGVDPGKALGAVSASEVRKRTRLPSDDPHWKLRSKGACRDIFFLALCDKLPEMVAAMATRADEAGYPSRDLGVYIQPMVQGSNYHCEFNMFYNPASWKESDLVRSLGLDATSALANMGAFFSRPYGESSRTIMNRDAATVAALKRLKAIFDPHGIMNPGRLCF